MQNRLLKKNEILKSIEFSISCISKEIGYGHIQISNKFLYSDFSDKICQGGLLDKKLGANKKNNCETCQKNIKKCLGHFGYLKLFLPVFNLGYIKSIQIILQIICKACSRVLIKPGKKRNKILQNIRESRKKGENYRVECFTEIIRECRNVLFCYYCSCKNGVIKKNGSINFIHDTNLERNKNLIEKNISQDNLNFSNDSILNPLSIFMIFQKIKFEDLEILDIDEIESRPENLLLCFIPIPPLSVRPNIFIGEKISNEDDLTLKLSEIQFINFQLKNNLEKNNSLFNLKENWNILQIECSKYLNSENFSSENGGQLFKSLFQRLKGKNGRFRGNLSGKRVDFSGRTIISPDPNMSLNIIGLPIQMAIKLTFPEKVTKINFLRIQRAVFRGPKKFPGALFLIDSKKNKKIIQNQFDEKIILEIKEGFKVERHLKNNDIALFNRQPSLHRISIMAHRIKVISGKTFKFNECVCKPYNADFDGDEMNIHIPQTQKARAESVSLLNLVINLNSPGTGETQVAATQDFLSASFLLTCKDKFFSRSDIGQIFGIFTFQEIEKTFLFPAIIKPLTIWTGKQIFSSIICPKIKKNNFFSKKTKFFLFQKENLFHTIEKIYSLEENQCSPFMCPYDGWILIKKGKLLAGQIGKHTVGSGNKKSLINWFSNLNSFSFIVKCLQKISRLTSNWFSEYGFSFGIEEISASFNQESQKNRLIFNCYNICESIQNNFFSKILKKKYFQTNPEPSIQKIFGNLREDIGKNCFDFKYLNSNSGSVMILSGSKGSIINISQMTICLGQQSIIGTRITKGFIERVLPHFKIEKWKSNPQLNGFIEKSFYQGLTGIDFFFHSMAGREGLIDTAVKTSETGYLQRRMMKTLEDIIIFYDASTRTSDGRLIQMKFDGDCADPNKISFLSHWHCYINNKFSKNIFLKNKNLSLSENLTFLRAFSFSSMDSVSFFLKVRDFYFSCFLFGNFKSDISFLFIEKNCQKIIENSKKCLIEPGNSVGAIAAQSLGEPCTQMTLQTFHFAGVSDITITLGVPRINEIMNASKNIADLIVDFNFSSMRNKEKFFKIKIETEKIYLGEICKKLDFIISSKLIFIDLYLKKNFILKLGLNINFKKIIKIIKNLENFMETSTFFYQRFNCVIRIFPKKLNEEQDFSSLETIKFIHFCKRNLLKVSIFGFTDSKNIMISQNFFKSSIVLKNIKFIEIFDFPILESNTIYCNHILTIFETLGIEASRQSIIFEIQKIFELYKISINKKHIALLADIMTFQGEVLGITRYGLSKMKKNVLVLASFEKTIDNLFLAATNDAKDKILGVSETIILGKTPPIGTGIVCLKNI